MFKAALILCFMFSRRTFLQLMAASGAAISGTEYLAQVAAKASPGLLPKGSDGIQQVVLVMLENRSFDHFLGWLPGADGRTDLVYEALDGKFYPNYPLAPDFQGCGYSDPDHSWEGWLVQHNYGKMNGFLHRPTAIADNPGVTPAMANTFPIGYYTNLNPDGTPKAVPDLPVIGALAQNYTVLDHYFCSFAGETYPNRFYQHSARTDRDHNSFTLSKLPAIWDQLSPVANTHGIPTGAYFFRNLPFLGLWGSKYQSFWHLYGPGDEDVFGIPVTTPTFFETVTAGDLPNVSFVDPNFALSDNGTGADDHPQADIRRGEMFVADIYHALATAGYLDNTVLVITFDEWGGFYDHVRPPQVIDHTNPATVNHSGDVGRVDGRRYPNYRQLGFRVPCIVVSNLASTKIDSKGPYEHTSTLRMIETTFGLKTLTARDKHAKNLREVLEKPKQIVPQSAIPTSSEVSGPTTDDAAVCNASSVQSVSPNPVRHHRDVDHDHDDAFAGQSLPLLSGGYPTGFGMAELARKYRRAPGLK